MLRKIWTIGFISIFVLCTAALAQRDRLLDTQEGTIPADGVSQLRMDVAAGSLQVIGDPEASQVRYRAEFRGEDEAMLDRMQFDHRVNGGTIDIRTRTDSRGWGNSGRIDLTLWAPSSLVVDIKDGSGSMKVGGFDRDVFIDDGSGSIDVEDIGGNLEIEDGSGSIQVSGLGGSARIRDGSGSVSLRDVGGSVAIRDGSGGISVRDVEGDFEVESDGSGGIDYSRIAGRVRVPEKKRRKW